MPQLKKLTVDGVIIDANWLTVSYPVFNIFGTPNGLYLYSPASGKARLYDWCSRAVIACMATPSLNGWGFSLSNYNNNFLLTEGFYSDNERIITGSLSNFTAPATCTDNSTILVDPTTTLPGSDVATMGVTSDEAGYTYAVIQYSNTTSPLESAFIRKYNSSGQVVDETAVDNTENQTGWFGARGIVYSRTSGYLYVSTIDDCIAVFDKNLNYVPALSIPYVPSALPKALGIVTECCVSPTTLTTTETLCGAQVGQKIYLRDYLPCDNLPAGNYSVSGAIATYNSCDQSVTLTGNNGTVQFTYSRPASTNNSCGATLITVNLNIVSSSTSGTFTTPLLPVWAVLVIITVPFPWYQPPMPRTTE